MRFVNIEWMRSKGESKKEFETNVKKNWNENFKKDLKKQEEYFEQFKNENLNNRENITARKPFVIMKTQENAAGNLNINPEINEGNPNFDKDDNEDNTRGPGSVQTLNLILGTKWDTAVLVLLYMRGSSD